MFVVFTYPRSSPDYCAEVVLHPHPFRMDLRMVLGPSDPPVYGAERINLRILCGSVGA